MDATSRLGVYVPQATDPVENWPGDAAQAFGVVDAVMMWAHPSVFADRPAPSSVKSGTLHLSTDSGIVSLSDGTAWWNLQSNLPIGSIQAYMGTSNPVDSDDVVRWLICDGSTFSGTSYPSLAYILGGTTLPNLKGRTLLGAGTGTASDATNDTLGTYSGSETQKLTTTAQLPGHTHTFTSDAASPWAEGGPSLF